MKVQVGPQISMKIYVEINRLLQFDIPISLFHRTPGFWPWHPTLTLL
jgi:hypothetical protein